MKFKLFGILWDSSYFYYSIKAIFTPSCWIRNHPTDKKWDASVLRELKSPNFEYKDEYTVILNGKRIWIENMYYACVRDYDSVNGLYKNQEKLTSRKTAFLFYDLMDRGLK